MNINKKILFIINGLGFGGAETHLLRLSKALLDKNYNIFIITLSNDLALLNQLDKRIVHFNIPLRKNLGLINDLKKILRTVKSINTDIIHAHLFHANIISRFIKLFYKKIRIINTTHGAYLLNTRSYNPYKIYRLTQKYVDYHTTVSFEVLDLLLLNKSVKKRNSAFVPNGLFVKEYRSNNKRNNNFKWLTIGRFHPVKEYVLLIKAISIVKEVFPNITLHIAGDGVEHNNIAATIKQYNLNNNVKLLGIIDDVPNLLSKYDGFVISSSSEGLPMVLLEAMSASLPIVSTNVGEIKSVLTKSNGGFLLNPLDKKLLAKSMIDMMKLEHSKRLKLGNNNRNFVEENYNIEHLANTWLKIYYP